jgi:hypothetical protein
MQTRRHHVHRHGRNQANALWDSLRGDPRFEKIITSLAPKGDASPAK